MTISLAAVFLAKNTRLPHQKCPQVSKLAALFSLHSGIFYAKNRFASRVPPPPSCILREIFRDAARGAAGFIDKTGKRPSEKSFRRPLFIEAALSDSLVLHVVSGRRGIAAAARPIGVEKRAARAVGALVGVCAEVVALRLQQVGGQPLGGVAVQKGNRGGHTRHGDT